MTATITTSALLEHFEARVVAEQKVYTSTARGAWCREHGVSLRSLNHWLKRGGVCPRSVARTLGYARCTRYRLLTEALDG